MLEEKMPSFPEGSIIVREIFSGSNRAKPELLSVMVKQRKGFNPKSGDWQFMVLDGAATKIEAREKVADCLSCHSKQKDQDFVFRTYLPAETRRKLQ